MKVFFKALTFTLVIIIAVSCMVFTVSADVGLDGINYAIDSENFTATATKFYGSQKDVVIPEKVNGFTVTGIAESAFEDSSISSVVIPNTITSLGKYAFDNCTDLTEVVVPASVTEIGDYAFRGCTALKSVELNANVNEIPFSSFQNCTALEKITVSDSITSIAAYAFLNCTALKSFRFDNIEAFSTGSFESAGLTEVIISDKVNNLPMQVFKNCSNLTRVQIGRNVNSIAFNAFRGVNDYSVEVWYGTYGYQYAKDKNLIYTLLDGVKLGDVDGDGDITITDATTIQRYLAELETLDAIHLYAADANEDKEVDIADATAIQMAVAKIPTGHPIGEVITK